MNSSRTPGRLLIFSTLLWRLATHWYRRKPEQAKIHRILILHQFLLGDALMATSLLAKAREQHPDADIILACPPLQAPLYQTCPYGICAIGWHPKDFLSILALFKLPSFDVVYLMGENRLSFLARAIGARWIVGFAGELPKYKNWFVDEAIPYYNTPEAWTDTAARLVAGPEPKPYCVEDWPIGAVAAPVLPQQYVVLHVGARVATRYWKQENWRMLSQWIRLRQVSIVWSCGPGEENLLEEIEPLPSDVVFAGDLSLSQLRLVFAKAAACVCPDTGVAHLAKIAGTPLVMLFGPGSEVLFGASRFFKNYLCVGVGAKEFICRNQNSVHYRNVGWVLRCFRQYGQGPKKCSNSLCMDAILLQEVYYKLDKFLVKKC